MRIGSKASKANILKRSEVVQSECRCFMDAIGFNVCSTRVTVAAENLHQASLTEVRVTCACYRPAVGQVAPMRPKTTPPIISRRGEGYRQHRGSDWQTEQPIGDLVRETAAVQNWLFN